jgi:hypothetical protein
MRRGRLSVRCQARQLWCISAQFSACFSSQLVSDQQMAMPRPPQKPAERELNNGDAKTPNGEFSPFQRLRARGGAQRRQVETHGPRVFGCLERFPVK